MKIQLLHPAARIPKKVSPDAAAYDIIMPEGGSLNFADATAENELLHTLGFALEIPVGQCVLLMPRSGVGFKHGLYIRNTIGLIDPDYRGPVMASLGVIDNKYFSWHAGERLLQMLIVPSIEAAFSPVDKLSPSQRDTGGFGSTGTMDTAA